MDNNVYVGERYVPIFWGDFDNTRSYEPLSIVIYGNNSYTSKRPVPAGVIPTDTDYWVLTGNYNGMISSLDSRISALENDVSSIPTQRHIILCGDSYVQGVGGGGTTIEGVIESLTNWDVRSYYAGGCGYLRPNVDNKKMIDVVREAITDTADKDLITDVVLAASVYNDSGMASDPSFNESSFITAIENINALVKANFPKARVTVIPSLWINEAYNNTFLRIFEWTMAAAQAIGANYANNSIDWLLVYDSSVQAGDNSHPSALGMTIIANHIATVINGGQASLYSGIDYVTTATNDTIGFVYYPDHVHISGTITKESGQTFNSLFDTPQPLQKLTNYPVPYVKYGDNVVNAFLITNASTYFGSVWLEENESYIIDCDVPYHNRW